MTHSHRTSLKLGCGLISCEKHCDGDEVPSCNVLLVVQQKMLVDIARMCISIRAAVLLGFKHGRITST